MDIAHVNMYIHCTHTEIYIYIYKWWIVRISRWFTVHPSVTTKEWDVIGNSAWPEEMEEQNGELIRLNSATHGQLIATAFCAAMT